METKLMEAKKVVMSVVGNVITEERAIELLKENDNDINKVIDIILEEQNVIAEAQPKTIKFEVGINGVPKLDINCDTEMSVRDIATALATIDVLNFNNYLRKDIENETEAMRKYVMFETLRKQIFIESIAKLGVSTKTLEALAEL